MLQTEERSQTIGGQNGQTTTSQLQKTPFAIQGRVCVLNYYTNIVSLENEKV